MEDCSMDGWRQLIWRAASSDYASGLAEVENEWTLDDLLECCELLDYKYDVEKQEYDKMNK